MLLHSQTSEVSLFVPAPLATVTVIVLEALAEIEEVYQISEFACKVLGLAALEATVQTQLVSVIPVMLAFNVVPAETKHNINVFPTVGTDPKVNVNVPLSVVPVPLNGP